MAGLSLLQLSRNVLDAIFLSSWPLKAGRNSEITDVLLGMGLELNDSRRLATVANTNRTEAFDPMCFKI